MERRSNYWSNKSSQQPELSNVAFKSFYGSLLMAFTASVGLSDGFTDFYSGGIVEIKAWFFRNGVRILFQGKCFKFLLGL